jgi:hypothetical protein
MLNPLKINDWEAEKYIVLMMAAHALILLVNGFYLGSLDLQFFRQTIGFVYLRTRN